MKFEEWWKMISSSLKFCDEEGVDGKELAEDAYEVGQQDVFERIENLIRRVIKQGQFIVLDGEEVKGGYELDFRLSIGVWNPGRKKIWRSFALSEILKRAEEETDIKKILEIQHALEKAEQAMEEKEK